MNPCLCLTLWNHTGAPTREVGRLAWVGDKKAGEEPKPDRVLKARRGFVIYQKNKEKAFKQENGIIKVGFSKQPSDFCMENIFVGGESGCGETNQSVFIQYVYLSIYMC